MKNIIVTGGSRGIGKAICYELIKNKYNVILNYNKSENEANIIKHELNEMGYNIDIFKADVTKKEEIGNMVNYAIDKYLLGTVACQVMIKRIDWCT